MVFNSAELTDIRTLGSLNEGGVDEYASVIMKFGEKGIATFNYSIANQLSNTALILGTKGTIKVSRTRFY